MSTNFVLLKGHDYGHDDHHGGGYDEHPVGGYKDHGGHGHHRRIASLVGDPTIPVYHGNHYDNDNARQDSKMYASLNSIFPEEKDRGYKDPFYSGYKGDNYKK